MSRCIHWRVPLDWSGVAAALAKIDATNCAPSTKRALRFTALTAARQTEVRRATWEQFDVEAALWVKPSESMKTGKAHRVPLSVQALDVLGQALAEAHVDGLVFAGSRPGEMLGDKVMTPALRKAGVAASGHGLPVELQGLGAAPRHGRIAVGVCAGACGGFVDGGRPRARRSAG